MLCRWALLLGSVGLALSASVPLAHLSQEDVLSITAVLDRAVKEAKEVGPAHFGAAGLALLSLPVPDSARLCSLSKTFDKASLESLHHAAALAVLAKCPLGKVAEAAGLVDGVLAQAKPSAQDLYYAAALARDLEMKMEPAKLTKALKASLAADDSAGNLGYAFHAAALALPAAELGPFVQRIEDTVAQADTVDQKYMQYEGGLSVTAIAVSGMYQLADKSGKAPSIKADEAVKLANYLLSRRSVQLARPAFHLLTALKALTANKFHVPVSISLASNVAVSGDVVVSICDLMGKGVGALSVSLDSATHLPTAGVVASKKPLAAVAGDKTGTRYSFKLAEAGGKAAGFYKLLISAASSSDKRLVGTQAAQLQVKVMADVAVEGAELRLQDKDSSSPGKTLKLTQGQKLPGAIEASSHQKLFLTFRVVDSASKAAMAVHQAFVVFAHSSGQEIVYVAEAGKDKTYSFDVDLGKSAKDFDHLSGQYSMRLLVGDAVVRNPLDWELSAVKLSFPEVEKPKKARHEEVFLAPRPEIKHVFRTPEKRPPQVVSDAFTLAALAPAALLLVLWAAIGVNVSNFPFSLYAVAFHLGLGGILGVYGLFFLHLNMFTTLKYTAAVGGLTFLAGNRMLAGIAQRRKAKAE